MSGTLESLADSGALARLPNVSSARLPKTYEKAKEALAECSRIDECLDWADKAEALASYAKQAKDDQLRKMADRIQARAVRRAGELLKQIPPAAGTRTDKPRTGTDTRLTRSSAAHDAGMSKRQKDTALRIATIPKQDFERQVESERPPTVTKLAEQGKKTLLDIGKSKPHDFALATQALATLRRFAEFCGQHDPIAVASGVQAAEAARARANVKAIDAWLDKFITHIGD